MLEYRTYRKIRHLWLRRSIPLREIARMLSLDRKTVRKWAKKEKYEDSRQAKKPEERDFGDKASSAITQPVVAHLDNNESWMLGLLLGNVTPTTLINTTSKNLTMREAEVFLKSVAEGSHREKIRGLSVLMYLRGTSIRQIGRLLTIDRSTAREIIRRYRENGLNDLFLFRKSKPKKHELPEYKDALFSILHSPPSDHGINRTSWIIPNLQLVMRDRGFPINKHSLRLIIKKTGYRFRKAKKVLTSTDPDYRIKLESITGILSRLTESELFFSICVAFTAQEENEIISFMGCCIVARIKAV